MTEIIGVRFKDIGKVYYFDPQGKTAEAGQMVIVETARGLELGECTVGNKMVEDNEIVSPLKPLIRIATDEDLRIAEQTKKKEKEAFIICNECIEKHKIDMHLVDAEYTFDGSKLMFYFTSDGRVDFRELLKELARIFRTRIDLRQIGVRDEAKMLGGIGICGRPFCCSSFLNEFQPVSIKMAKEQSLSLNPMKISGACGRLMCCLKYEQAAYEDLAKRVPPVGSLVETPDGKGIVTEATLLKERVKVRLDRAPDQPPAEYTASQCTILKKSRGGYDKTENIPD
ncbi:MAG: stage 0 sporulation family protein [Clostridia bacterium]|nr:stage 0 sporulation family protein [Clostridia bacterium]